MGLWRCVARSWCVSFVRGRGCVSNQGLGEYEDGLARVIVSMGMGAVYGLFQRGREFIRVKFW